MNHPDQFYRQAFKNGQISSQRGSCHSWHGKDSLECILYKVSEVKVENLLLKLETLLPVCEALQGDKRGAETTVKLTVSSCYLVF